MEAGITTVNIRPEIEGEGSDFSALIFFYLKTFQELLKQKVHSFSWFEFASAYMYIYFHQAIVTISKQLSAPSVNGNINDADILSFELKLL